MNPQTACGVHCRYKLQVRKHGIILKESGWSYNRITNNGLDIFGTSSKLLNYTSVGSGSAAPTDLDTQLQARIASITDGESTYTVDSAKRYAILRVTRTFLNGTAAGTIAEVGIGEWNNGTSLFSRALVLDQLGVPTTISVLSDEDLVVIYELWIKQPTEDFVHTVNGIQCTTRAANVDNLVSGNFARWGAYSSFWGSSTFQYAFTGPNGIITAKPSGTMSQFGTLVAKDYVPGSYKRGATITFGTNTANFDIKSFMWSFGPGVWQTELSVPITKTNIQTFKFGVEVAWERDNGPAV